MKPPRPGLDTLRVFAAAAVFWGHCCSLTGNDALAIVNGFHVAKAGTATFFALGGLLAAATSRSAAAWLCQRLSKLFPPFWAALALSFVAAAVTGYKPFDATQVLCQMAGVGLFTHQGHLVNVATWFVSLLLVLYLVVFVAEATAPRASLGLACLVAVVLALHTQRAWHLVSCHSLTFLAAYAVGRFATDVRAGLLASCLVFLVLAQFIPFLVHGALALVLLGVAYSVTLEVPAARAFRTFAYEWFLIHGLCLHAASRLAGGSLPLVCPLALALAVPAAAVFQRCLARFSLALRPIGARARLALSRLAGTARGSAGLKGAGSARPLNVKSAVEPSLRPAR